MIILIILTIALFASWLLIPQKLSRYIIGSIVTFLFVVQIIGIVANMTHHFGMQKETIHESEKRIYSAANSKSPAQMLIANEIGNITKMILKLRLILNQRLQKKIYLNLLKNRLIMKHLMTIMLR